MENIWQLCICNKNDDISQKRQQGDIISYKPFGLENGPIVSRNCLIVLVKNITIEEIEQLKEVRNNAVKDIHRFQIPISIIHNGWYEIDNGRLTNDELIYQPLLNEKIIIDLNEMVAVCKDKNINRFKYNTLKAK